MHITGLRSEEVPKRDGNVGREDGVAPTGPFQVQCASTFFTALPTWMQRPASLLAATVDRGTCCFIFCCDSPTAGFGMAFRHLKACSRKSFRDSHSSNALVLSSFCFRSCSCRSFKVAFSRRSLSKRSMLPSSKFDLCTYPSLRCCIKKHKKKLIMATIATETSI